MSQHGGVATDARDKHSSGPWLKGQGHDSRVQPGTHAGGRNGIDCWVSGFPRVSRSGLPSDLSTQGGLSLPRAHPLPSGLGLRNEAVGQHSLGTSWGLLG